MPKMPAVTLVAAVTIAVAGACGSSGTKHTTAATATTVATPSSAEPMTTTAKADVVTKVDAKLGTILADGSGKTLYTLTANGKAVPCSGACASVWPPLLAGSAAPVAGNGVSGLGVAAGANGERIVTHDGLPLYRFSRDQDAGDAYGEGITSFGGTWHVVKVGAASTTSSVLSGGGGY
jgi:predicted lipoprotein with Yx(FWY)xxD motif